ncbi:MAG: hypothetical protein AAF533_13685 [Acidobacteriota bacterium]
MLLVSCLALGTGSASASTLRLEPVLGTPGQALSIPVSLDSTDPCVGGVTFEVVHAAELTFTEASAADESCLLHAESIDDTTLRVGLLCPDLLHQLDDVLQLDFTLSSDATEGVLDLGLTFLAAADCNGSTIELSGEDGEVAVGMSCELPGDVYPDGAGDGVLDLRDFLLAGRKALLQTNAVGGHDLLCADFHPGATLCTTEAGVTRWCAEGGDGSLGLDEVALIRGLVAGTVEISCDPCLAALPVDQAFVPGDVAPLGDTNGVADIGDVVQCLRWSVGLDELPTDDVLLRADVSPTEDDEALEVVVGNDTIDISDVVQLLRASVGLDTLAWPRHELAVTIDAPAGIVGYRVGLDGWPLWAEVIGHEGAGCGEDDGDGLDEVVGLVTLTCTTDPDPVLESAGDLVVVTYRAPESVPLEGDDAVTLTSELVDAALFFVDAELGMEGRQP